MKYSGKQISINIFASVIAVLLLVLGSATHAQVIKADSTQFLIGSKIDLTIEVPYSDGDIIKWPVFSDTITHSIEILSKTAPDTVLIKESGKKTIRQVLSITSFDTGFIIVPPIPFEIKKNGGQPELYKTEPLLLEVQKMKINSSADIKDIKPIFKAPYTFRDFLPWIILLLIVASITWGIRYFIKKRKQAALNAPVIKLKIPVWDLAYQKLEVLKTEKLWQQGHIKEYYTRLTDILREYFELRFNVSASEMTSGEILESMRSYIKDPEAWESLRNLLFLSDMAKFAKAQPSPQENERSIFYGIGIVTHTKPEVIEIQKLQDDHEAKPQDFNTENKKDSKA